MSLTAQDLGMGKKQVCRWKFTCKLQEVKPTFPLRGRNDDWSIRLVCSQNSEEGLSEEVLSVLYVLCL